MSDEKPKLVMVRYEQSEDDSGHPDDIQTIGISLLNSGAGDYYKIETEGWAIDRPEDLLELFKVFQG